MELKLIDGIHYKMSIVLCSMSGRKDPRKKRKYQRPKQTKPRTWKVTIIETKSVFGNVVVGAFQITFRVKIHANDVFSFFKNHF
jgi:hypothetical protein